MTIYANENLSINKKIFKEKYNEYEKFKNLLNHQKFDFKKLNSTNLLNIYILEALVTSVISDLNGPLNSIPDDFEYYKKIKYFKENFVCVQILKEKNILIYIEIQIDNLKENIKIYEKLIKKIKKLGVENLDLKEQNKNEFIKKIKKIEKFIEIKTFKEKNKYLKDIIDKKI